MKTTPTPVPLATAQILALLSPTLAANPTPAYQRLLEIYCVVKAGGIAAQVATVKRFEAQERADLGAQIAALEAGTAGTEAGTDGDCSRDSQRQALAQEVVELERSVGDRLTYLSSILPEEEAAVYQCLAEIEAHLQRQAQSAVP